MLPRGLLKEYSQLLSLIMRFIDVGIVLLAAWLAYYSRFTEWLMPHRYRYLLLAAALLTFVIFDALHIYSSKRCERFIKHTVTLIQAIVILSCALAGLAFYLKLGEVYSRIWFSLWMLYSIILLIIARLSLLLLLRLMRRQGINERRVIILGASELGLKLASAVQAALWTGFRIVELLDDQTTSTQFSIKRPPHDLSQYLTEQQIDELWIALPLHEVERVKKIVQTLRQHPITIRFTLDIFSLDLLNHSVTDIAGFPVLNVSASPMVGINRIIKAAEDRIMALLILLLISPLFCCIALAVKLTSRGPIFFKQKRLGWNGEVINVYKFRTMYQHQEAAGQITQATADDKRVTPLGKWLRCFSLDELPQFVNVLQGRMSIVGPRPHALAHNALYKEAIASYMQRHHVKPGITGWAQVNGWRGETDTLEKMQKRIEYDLYYINNWSLAFDLQIIALTLFKGFKHRNAY